VGTIVVHFSPMCADLESSSVCCGKWALGEIDDAESKETRRAMRRRVAKRGRSAATHSSEGKRRGSSEMKEGLSRFACLSPRGM